MVSASKRPRPWINKASPRVPEPLLSSPRRKEDWQGLFEQLEAYLDDVNYFRVPEKKQVVWQNLRSMLLRGRFTGQEIRTLRGMLRLLWEGRKPRKSEAAQALKAKTVDKLN